MIKHPNSPRHTKTITENNHLFLAVRSRRSWAQRKRWLREKRRRVLRRFLPFTFLLVTSCVGTSGTAGGYAVDDSHVSSAPPATTFPVPVLAEPPTLEKPSGEARESTRDQGREASTAMRPSD